jgi:hypothetical protein
VFLAVMITTIASTKFKSNERHFCKFCKCWTQGDPVSIKRHEVCGRSRALRR